MEIGFIAKMVKGKMGNTIGYDENGKVIVIKGNQLDIGYAQITNILEDKGNYYVCRGRNVLYDYYKGIETNKLIRLLKTRFDYKVAFRRNECNLTDEEMNNKTHIKQVCLYNVDMKTVIVINDYITIDDMFSYRDILVMCPGIDEKISRSGCKFTREGERFSVYNLPELRVYYPVHYIHNKILKEPEKHRLWKDNVIDFGLSDINNTISYYHLKSIINKEDLYNIFEEGSKMRDIISK